jgi:DNA-directed RNA polymerase specialized sigma24 family protein
MIKHWPTVVGLASAAQQRAYLLRTVTNETLQIRRRADRRRELFTLGDMDPSWMPEFPGGAGEAARGLLRRVWQAISEFPAATREVVALFAAGYDYREGYSKPRLNRLIELSAYVNSAWSHPS